jgi:hypothetical protein
MDGRRIDGLRAKKKEETAQESDPAWESSSTQMAGRLPQVRVEMCEVKSAWHTGETWHCGKKHGEFERFPVCHQSANWHSGRAWVGRNCARERLASKE